MISFINLSLRVERIAFRTMCVSAGRRRIGCVKAHSHWPVSREALQSWPILAINIRFISLPSILGQILPSSRNIFRAHPFVSLLTWDHPNLDNLPRDVWQTRLNAFVDILLLLPRSLSIILPMISLPPPVTNLLLVQQAYVLCCLLRVASLQFVPAAKDFLEGWAAHGSRVETEIGSGRRGLSDRSWKNRIDCGLWKWTGPFRFERGFRKRCQCISKFTNAFTELHIIV